MMKIMETKCCIICGKETKTQYAMEADSPKFSYCRKHEIHVTTYVIQLLTDDSFDPEKWLLNVRKNESKRDSTKATKKRK